MNSDLSSVKLTMNIDNIENNLISFELSDEDVQAIRGGSTEEASVHGAYRCHFPFPITCVVVGGDFPTSSNPKKFNFPISGTPISVTPQPPVRPIYISSQAS